MANHLERNRWDGTFSSPDHAAPVSSNHLNRPLKALTSTIRMATTICWPLRVREQRYPCLQPRDLLWHRWHRLGTYGYHGPFEEHQRPVRGRPFEPGPHECQHDKLL